MANEKLSQMSTHNFPDATTRIYTVKGTTHGYSLYSDLNDEDWKLMVSLNDVTPNYLSDKLIAGTAIDLIEVNDGGNETYSVNLDTTEISDTIWGSGTGGTWSFDTGGITPSMDFDNGIITITVPDFKISGNLWLSSSNKELRFYEGVNYVGFEAPALIANQIWVLPVADGIANDVIKTDGAGKGYNGICS